MLQPNVIVEAYFYLLGRALVVRQERRDLAAPGVAYNRIEYNPLGSAEFVNPNFDVAYLEAWIAVDAASPALLEVPEVTGRYWTAQILDEWGEVIANINPRTMPARSSGTFAFLAPGSGAAVPPGAGTIYLHSSKAKLLARIELQRDPEGALALQRRFRLSGGAAAPVAPPALPDFDNATLIGAALFDAATALLASALDVSPGAAELQQKVRAVADHVASGAAARQSVDELLVKRVIPGVRALVASGNEPNETRWSSPDPAGNYGADHRMRTVVNLVGIWANTRDEVIYLSTAQDARGAPLDGAQHYVMRFPAGRLPSSVVDGYWSIMLVGIPDYRVTANPLARYHLNSYSPLALDADGSLAIGFGPTPPGGVPESNWLPSPARPFALTFRTYLPKPSVGKEWYPAAVTPAKPA
ncbi:MAG TPA: DUF1214 domain-containing protein [Polyangiaceae bacterium]|nr:DUF1214 domain-containing protein [Polyangiaceae bacterium]